ncbi:MAG TPA: hypothetical protein VM370_04075 [Candidatus Thermoplasmatota archaeon]|nr:hypothetical protein [Candidatus Thermoplasmatota archaeon]
MPPRPPPDETAYATHLAGGLLLGAALVSLVRFFVPVGVGQPVAALGLGALCAAAAYRTEEKRGELVAEAGYAAGLLSAASVPFYAISMPLLGLLAALLAVALTRARRGTSPVALLALATFFVGAQHAARVDLLAPRDGAAELLFLSLLAGYGALLVRQRHARWAGIALAGHGIAIALAIFPLLDALGVTDAGIAALAVGACAGGLLLLALRIGARALVATSSALLTLAALVFAFTALGPALAAIVLLLLGALLVWQAEAVRGYFAA